MRERNPSGRNRSRTLGALEIYPERCRKAAAQTRRSSRPTPAPPPSPGQSAGLASRAGSGAGEPRRAGGEPGLRLLSRPGSTSPHPPVPGAGPPASLPAGSPHGLCSRRRPRGRRCHWGQHAAAAAPGGGEREPARSSGSAAPAARALPRCSGAAPRPLPPGPRGRGEPPGVGAARLSGGGSRAGRPGSAT